MFEIHTTISHSGNPISFVDFHHPSVEVTAFPNRGAGESFVTIKNTSVKYKDGVRQFEGVACGFYGLDAAKQIRDELTAAIDEIEKIEAEAEAEDS